MTEVQLDTLLASKEEGNLNFKRALREKHKVTKGAFRALSSRLGIMLKLRCIRSFYFLI